MAIDSHCHLNDDAYNEDLNQVIERLDKSGVNIAVTIGYDLESSIKGLEIANANENIYCVVGFHPECVASYKDEMLLELEKLCDNEKVVAIGEIGLDYHYEGYDKDLQKEIFIKQLDLARKLQLPVVIHQRDCGFDLLEILKKHSHGIKGIILHCFSESVEMAKEFLKLGCYISFAGTLTFKNARQLPEVAKLVPLDKMLTETDCPYLTPHPFRGRRNEPSYVTYVVEKLAEIKGMTVTEIEKQVEDNLKRVFDKIK